MMGHELQRPTEPPAQNSAGSVPDLTEPPQELYLQLAVRPPLCTKLCSAKLRIERICYAVDLGSPKPRIIQTKANRTFGKLVRILYPRFLGMLDAVEPLFLAGRYDLAIDNQGGGRFVKHRIDSKNVHPGRASPSLGFNFGTANEANATTCLTIRRHVLFFDSLSPLVTSSKFTILPRKSHFMQLAISPGYRFWLPTRGIVAEIAAVCSGCP